MHKLTLREVRRSLGSVVLAWATGVGALAGEPKDLEEYVAQARRTRMSELAEADLRTMAEVLTGATMLTFSRMESGGYATTYRSGFCPLPGADSAQIERLRVELATKVAEALPRVKAVADRDRSGFVSTVEGFDFRESLVFGLKVAQLVTASGLNRRQELVEATGLTSVQELERRVTGYNVVARLLKQGGVYGVDELVLPEDPESSR